MIMKTQITQTFRLSVDGVGYAGTAKDVKPPKISQKVETYRAGGMSGEIDIVLGTEMDALEFTLSETAPQVLKRFGFVHGADRPFTLRAGIKDDNGNDLALRYEIGGLLKEIDPGTTEAGKIVERKFSVSARSFKEFHDDVEILYIDHEKGIHRVGGEDLLEKARAAAGM